MRAKLIGFLQPMSQVLQSYPESDKSLPARYARAIAYYRVPNIDKAVTEIDALLQERPHDPYLHASKGQMLLEHGRVSASMPAYDAAVRVQPQSPQLRQALAPTPTLAVTAKVVVTPIRTRGGRQNNN